MDTNLVLILALSAAIAVVLVPLVVLIIREMRGKKVRHTEAENVVAKWLTEQSRQTDAMSRLRSDVQTLRTQVEKATKSEGKDTYKLIERIKQLEDDMDWAAGQIDAHAAAIEDLQPKAPANSTNGRYVR
jgi:phage shock protein A